MKLLIGCIYLITNLKNNHHYVGQHNKPTPKARWRGHIYEFERRLTTRPRNATSHLYKAFSKYGIENFIIEILYQVPVIALNKYEAYFANLLNTYSVNGRGYNIQPAGNVDYNPGGQPRVYGRRKYPLPPQTEKANIKRSATIMTSEYHNTSGLTNEKYIHINRGRFSVFIKNKQHGHCHRTTFATIEHAVDYRDAFIAKDTVKMNELAKHKLVIEKYKKLAKLTDDDVKEIRMLYASGNFTQKELADKYKVTHSRISTIVNNKARTK